LHTSFLTFAYTFAYILIQVFIPTYKSKRLFNYLTYLPKCQLHVDLIVINLTRLPLAILTCLSSPTCLSDAN
jgi:hypothetical protein